MRHGALVESDDGERRILVDTPPELRLQLLAAGVSTIDAVWFTHSHADHIHGVDDLRIFSERRRAALAAYAGPECVRALKRRFRYIFDPASPSDYSTTRPQVLLHPVESGVPVDVAGFSFLPLPVPHGSVTSYGFRVGRLGYVTDAKTLPDATIAALRGVKTLVLNALWFSRTHPGHLNIEEAVQVAERVAPDVTYLVHLTHRVAHGELLARLPAWVRPAHDGLVVEID